MSYPRNWHNPPSITPAVHGEVKLVAGLAAGVVTAGDVNSQPTNSAPSSPSKWATIWFGTAVLYLVLVYSGQIRIAAER